MEGIGKVGPLDCMEGIEKLGSLDYMEDMGKYVECGVLGCITGVYPGGLIKVITDMVGNKEKSDVDSNQVKDPNMGGVEYISGRVGCTGGEVGCIGVRAT